LAKSKYKIKTVVLRPILDLSEAEKIVENGKTSLFRSMLQKPKKMEVHVHSIKLSYEAFLILSGKYNADFYRKAVHSINVEPTVREIIVGDGVFPIKQGRGVLGKLNYKIKSSTKRKNRIDLELEEHVYLDDEQEVAFDHHGKEIKMPYKMSSRFIESYPRRTLGKVKNNVKKPEITYDAAANKLIARLKKSVTIGRRNLVEKVVVNEIIELYVPIYEARFIGPKKNVRIMRIDGIRKIVLLNHLISFLNFGSSCSESKNLSSIAHFLIIFRSFLTACSNRYNALSTLEMAALLRAIA